MPTPVHTTFFGAAPSGRSSFPGNIRWPSARRPVATPAEPNAVWVGDIHSNRVRNIRPRAAEHATHYRMRGVAIALSSCLVGGSARAGDADNAITLEPLALVYARTIVLEYERGLGRVGLALASAVTLGDWSADGASGDYLALGATLAVRIYPWTEAPAGPFIGPFGGLAWVDASGQTSGPSSGGENASGIGWSVGALAGWSWTLGGGFVLSLGAGAAWYSYDLALSSGDTVGRHGFLPALRLAVGAAF